MDAVLTLVELAERLKVSLRTARRMVVRGDISAFKANRQWRVRETAVTAYIDHQTYELAQQRGQRSPVGSIRDLPGWDKFH